MSALAVLMIIAAAGLVVAAVLPCVEPAHGRASTMTGAAASLALTAAGVLATFDEHLVWQPFAWLALGRGGVDIDGLAGLFLIITGAVSGPLFVACSPHASRLSHAVRPLLVLTVTGVFVVDNVFEFLVLWELTAAAIYVLVSAGRDDPAAERAASLTLTLAKLGGASLLAGLVLLAAQSGTFSFEQLAHRGPELGAATRGICFALLGVGFAVKAAIVPLQAWLPGAYGSADADSAGFIAAISINVAFYGMLRMWFGFLGHPAVWWAAAVLLLGAGTALIGILGGVLQTRLRLFVAYSSIENAGIIVADLGLALIGSADRQPGLLGLGLVAATFQILAHSVAKAALFTAVGAVERSTGTSDMDRLGGLWRSLPWAAVATLSSAAALAALPPFSGFVSEWLGLEGLMQGFRVGGTGSHVTIALTGAILALTAGLAALAFVRALGMTFLGLPRDESIEPARETSSQRSALASLAFGSLALGVTAPWVVKLLERGTAAVGGGAANGHVSRPGWLIEPGYAHFASISPTVLGLSLIGFLVGAGALRYTASLRRRARIVPVWASTESASEDRVQYTPIGYANMVRVIFNVVYRVRTELQGFGDERFPEHLSMVRAEPRIFDPGWLYRPVTRTFSRVAAAVSRIQAGPLGLYLLYLLAVVVVLLLVAPRLT
jgi:formate hydrogenlyase subunit 3/multisubunit Na+/H+ antiporter MnhD subunit